MNCSFYNFYGGGLFLSELFLSLTRPIPGQTPAEKKLVSEDFS